MVLVPSVFQARAPRSVVAEGDLSDCIFAADLWSVFRRNPGACGDRLDPGRCFAGSHRTENLELLAEE